MHSERLSLTNPSMSDPADAAVDEAPDPLEGAPTWIRALVTEVMRAAASPAYLRWISASVGTTVRLLSIDDVLFFRSDTKYTRVVTADCEVLIRKPLRELRRELDPAIWWSIHRSTIVNVSAISEVARDMVGRPVVRLKRRPDKLPVSDSHAHRFRQM